MKKLKSSRQPTKREGVIMFYFTLPTLCEASHNVGNQGKCEFSNKFNKTKK